MKLPSLLAFAALAALTGPLLADDGSVDLQNFTTLSGRHYAGCQVLKVYPDGVTFHHSRGMAKVLFVDMKPELRAQFGYNADKAVAYQHKMHEDYLHARAVQARRNWREAEVTYLHEGGFAMPFGEYYPGVPWYGGYNDFGYMNGVGYGNSGFRFYNPRSSGLIDSRGRFVNENHGAVTVPTDGRIQHTVQPVVGHGYFSTSTGPAWTAPRARPGRVTVRK